MRRRPKRTAQKPARPARKAKTSQVVAELKKVHDQQLQQIAGGHAAEYICFVRGCYCR